MWLPCVLLLPLLRTARAQEPSESPLDSIRCRQPTEIKNGAITLSNELHVGSVQTLSCSKGHYPYPVQSRTCQSNGQWTQIIKRPSCKEILCPKPEEFENGAFHPRNYNYPINSTLRFDCLDGFELRGSQERTCKPNGRWSGTTAICDNKAGHCLNPGIPIGAIKTGTRYYIDDKVRYTCSRGLDLVGSKERVCQESGVWTGTEPSCQSQYSYDLPEDVSAQFDSSVANLVEVLNPFKKKKENLGRKVQVTKDGTLNIYILVDASESVKEKNFEEFKKAVGFFVRAFSSLDVYAHFGIFSYASETKTVISVVDDYSNDVAMILDVMEKNMTYSDHKGKSGTNIREALQKVYEMMSLQKARMEVQKKDWNAIRHVILLLTDGKSNMGGQPKEAIKTITDFLAIEPNRTDYLDVYAFGVGNMEVDKTELNEIASKKKGETHVFVMDSAEHLTKAFSSMLELKNVGDMCGLSSVSQDDDDEMYLQRRAPWHVMIQGKTACSGSLVSKDWVLTAAHCFHNIDTSISSVKLGGKSKIDRKIDQHFEHPCYNVKKMVSQGINETYDYDVALVKLNKPVEFSDFVRPICIPCTESTNRALKLPLEKKTCKFHKDTLLRTSEIPVNFISIHNTILQTTLMVDNKRDTCTSGIKTWPNFTDIDISKLITPRYLCTENNEGIATCKGESGGALYVTSNHRQYKLGAISWGVFNPCLNSKKDERKKPPRNLTPRDIHISLFEVQPWLKHYLNKDLPFLDDVKADSACPEFDH